MHTRNLYTLCQFMNVWKSTCHLVWHIPVVNMRIVVSQLQADIINSRSIQSNTQVHLTITMTRWGVTVTIGNHWWVAGHTVYQPET